MFLQMMRFSSSEVEPHSFNAPRHLSHSLVNDRDYTCTYSNNTMMLSGLSAQIRDFLAVDKHYS